MTPSASDVRTDPYRLLGHPTDLAGHISTLGRLPLPAVVDGTWRSAFAADLEASGLAGRGGAAFPAALKLAVARRSGSPWTGNCGGAATSSASSACRTWPVTAGKAAASRCRAPS